jgi:cytochrome c
MKKSALLAAIALFVFVSFNCNTEAPATGPEILVFTKTKGFHHESIPAGIAAIQKIGEQNGFRVDTTTDAAYFTEDHLKKYKAIVFVSSTGNILNADQQLAFQRYIEAGGGFAGIHGASDAEYNWAWYNNLVGAYFLSHPSDPNVRKATIVVTDTANPIMAGIPQKWERTDEWYNFKNINPAIKVLASLDEDSYEGGENGDRHPIAWYHDYDGGRAFYTGGGHTTESFSEPLFLKHIAAGIKYAMGSDSAKLDYTKAYAIKSPEENRFTKTIISNDLNEPMEFAVAPGGNVYTIERNGNFYVYDASSNSTRLAYHFPLLPDTKVAFGNGLLGVTLDPDFTKNRYIYFFYTPDKQPARQNISRFILKPGDSLDLASEKIIIEVPIDMEVSAHTGGSMAWDKNHNLFISTGDNTVPFASDGYAPIDDIPGRKVYNAQRSAGNTNDLRGKVLRIHPEADGSYTIPEGNLFAKGTPQTKPEIYTMGCRNPYRISVDQETSILYWGEVGPDAGENGAQGPRGYDEINQAKKAGNYGWPFFVGDNKPYHKYDFATKKIGELFNVERPENASPANTGMRILPPATSALIWYPYAFYDTFPALAQGGRTAMAGPVYHYNKTKAKPNSVPEYYDKALFIFDWMRNWIFAVRLNDKQELVRLEPFMPLTGDFRRPIDMEITPDGIMYVLEYGTVYGADNPDARLVRLDFNAGNRGPAANINADDSIGMTPLKIEFNGSKSYDFDEDDQLTYEWNFGNGKGTSKEINPEFTFTDKGIYHVTLKVTDPAGLSSIDTIEVKAGNTTPDITIEAAGNKSFYFEKLALNYAVNVKDKEDKNIDSQKVKVALRYIPEEAGIWITKRKQKTGEWLSEGKDIIAASDCKACHQLDKTVVGPAFTAVAERYKGIPSEDKRLADKIIKGGAGAWGNHYMNAHPQLNKNDALTVVHYILSLADQQTYSDLAAHGNVDVKAPGKANGSFVLEASYTDDGNGVSPLTGSSQLVLRPAKLKAVNADVLRRISRSEGYLGSIHHKSYFVFKNIDLTGIKQIMFNYASEEIGATLEVHKGSLTGPIVGTLNYKPTGSWEKFRDVTMPVADPGGINDLYFVFKKDTEPNHDMFLLKWLEFKK